MNTSEFETDRRGLIATMGALAIAAVAVPAVATVATTIRKAPPPRGS
jgi:hypothetical protein